jgi:hypothetical protein
MPGDPDTAEMREEQAAHLEGEDVWRISVGLPPMWAQTIEELRAAQRSLHHVGQDPTEGWEARPSARPGL